MKINSNPRVSLLIPCFNAQSHVSSAIDCVLKQTYGHIEIIIAPDDLDTYSNLRKKYKSPQIRIIPPSKVSATGPGQTRNRAIDAASGDFFTMLDADDVINTNYIENLLKVALVDGASVGLVKYSNMETNQIIRVPPIHNQYLSLSGFGQLLCSIHPLIHRSLENGYCSGFAEDVVHDGLIIGKLGTVQIVQDVFYDVKVRQGSETNKGKKMEFNIGEEYNKKINQIIHQPTQLGIQSLDFVNRYDFAELFKFRAYVSNIFANQEISCYNTWVAGKEAELWDQYCIEKSVSIF